MAYTPSYSAPITSPQPLPAYYPATPPAPPPKPSGPGTPSQGPPLPPPPPGYTHNEPLELDGSQGHHYQNQQYYQQQSTQQPSIPPIQPGWLPDIVKDKTTSDLHDLLNNSDLQSALISNPSTTHPSVTQSQHQLQPLLQSNIALSSSLADLEARLASTRASTQSRLLALRALEQQHRSKIAETEKALEQFSPMALYQRLSASVQEQEQLVRGIEESWLEEGGIAGEREVEGFVRRVKEARKVAFLRGERKERWDEGRVGGWR